MDPVVMLLVLKRDFSTVVTKSLTPPPKIVVISITKGLSYSQHLNNVLYCSYGIGTRVIRASELGEQVREFLGKADILNNTDKAETS